MNWIDQLPWNITLAEVEREVIRRTLVRHCGNRTHSAEVLGISLRGLKNKINAMRAEGISVPPGPTMAVMLRERQKRRARTGTREELLD